MGDSYASGLMIANRSLQAISCVYIKAMSISVNDVILGSRIALAIVPAFRVSSASVKLIGVRIAADTLLKERFNHPSIDWVAGINMEKSGTQRNAYTNALRAADSQDFNPFFDFVSVK